jgi:hypothetical protein
MYKLASAMYQLQIDKNMVEIRGRLYLYQSDGLESVLWPYTTQHL